jgi:CzcA family heavy metal efflux pump
MSNRNPGIVSGIVRFSLRFRGIVIALAVVLLCYGLYSLSGAKYDVFPEFAPPEVTIHAEAPGLSAEQVEELITRPVEDAVNGVQGIRSLRSTSIQGVSATTAAFRSDTDIYLARQKVAERLSSVMADLPQGATPVMTPLTSSTGTVLVLGLTSSNRSLMELRTVADWTVRKRLLAVPGVAKIAVFGGDVKQLQVRIRPGSLIRYNLSIEEVLSAARRATAVKGAGFIENENQRIVLKAEGQSLTPEQLGKTVLVYRNGGSVRLSDVADVVDAPGPPIGAGAVMGKPGVILSVSAQYGANTIEVTHKLEAAIRELSPALKEQGITLYPNLFRPAGFIETALGNMKASLLAGAILVVIVLFLFLFDFRTAAISCTAIPLSLLAAVTVVERLGFSLNTMTLGGLAIAIGEIVDDAVIDVENIFRRLRENRTAEKPLPAIRVVFDSSIEVRSAVVYATFAVALVFIPILSMPGVAGRLFAPLGIAYLSAIFASLLVALTVTPALCLLLLSGKGTVEKEPPVIGWMRKRYEKILLRLERWPKTLIVIAAALTVALVAAAPFLKAEFLPELREGNFIIHVSALPGTSLEESLRTGRQIASALLRLPFVETVAQRVGRAEEGEETRGSNASEFEVGLKTLKGGESESALQQMRGVMARFPGINFSIKTFLSERIEETISGYTAPVVVNIFGNDLGVLDRKAREVAAALRKVSGAMNVQIQSPPGTAQLIIALNRAALTRWGFAPAEVLDAVSIAYQARIAGRVYEGNRMYDVSVVLDPADRKSVADVGSLPLRNSEGTYVRLGQLANIYESSGRYAVLHEGGRRVQAVTCTIAGGDAGSFVKEAKARVLSTVSLPPGTYVQFAGTAQAGAEAGKDLLVYSLIAGMGIIMLLSIVLAHYRNVLLVLLNLPFALAGGMIAVLVSGGVLSIGSMVGFVTLFGITLRNSIMMISHYEHLVLAEGMPWGPQAAIRGASERLAPILMTASVTALGLLPLALGSGTAGREIEGPMAQVILGGLLTSTALNLIVLPTLSLRYGRFEKRDDVPDSD